MKKAAKVGRQRRMISVPPDVSTSMDDHPEVNWSKIAVEAFRVKLEAIKSVRELPQDAAELLDSVVDALRNVNRLLHLLETTIQPK